MIRITSNNGVIKFGPFRIVWWNQDEDFEGFTAISFGDRAIELGAVDQDLQGIYLTTYQDDEVVSTRPLFLLP